MSFTPVAVVLEPRKRTFQIDPNSTKQQMIAALRGCAINQGFPLIPGVTSGGKPKTNASAWRDAFNAINPTDIHEPSGMTFHDLHIATGTDAATGQPVVVLLSGHVEPQTRKTRKAVVSAEV